MGPLPVQNPELLKDQLMKRSQSGCKQLLRILQIGFPLRNNKSKYRGLIKQKTWAYCRCLWINLIRILNFTKQICQRTFKTMEIPAKEPFFGEDSILNHFSNFLKTDCIKTPKANAAKFYHNLH